MGFEDEKIHKYQLFQLLCLRAIILLEICQNQQFVVICEGWNSPPATYAHNSHCSLTTLTLKWLCFHFIHKIWLVQDIISNIVVVFFVPFYVYVFFFCFFCYFWFFFSIFSCIIIHLWLLCVAFSQNLSFVKDTYGKNLPEKVLQRSFKDWGLEKYTKLNTFFFLNM